MIGVAIYINACLRKTYDGQTSDQPDAVYVITPEVELI